MRRKKKSAVSIKQRKLMGYAYACATGEKENCPTSIEAIGKSFMKKGKKKGMKNLRSFAATKHKDLPLYKESHIFKFNEFDMIDEDKNVIDFLYSLKDSDLNGYINDFLTCRTDEKPDYLNDILLEIGDRVDDEKYKWVSNQLQKELNKK